MKPSAIFWLTTLVFGLLLPDVSLAQPGKNGAFTVTAAGTVLNQYAILGADATAGASAVTVTNIAHFSATTPFSTTIQAGDLILIIQMQGATIQTTDDVNYGAITAYNNAGNYEYAYVQSVAANVITLTCPLKQSYTATGRAQVVRVPQFTNLTIDAAASVTSVPWNYTAALTPALAMLPTTPITVFPAGQSARGGVVAIHVSGTLTNNGSVNVTGQGFRGGAIDGASSAANATVVTTYRSTSANDGAEKGEGIAGYQADYVTGRYARGAPANGGGGGNGHNAGGAGGANGNNGNAWFRGAGVMCSSCTGAAAWALDPDYIANGNSRTNSSGGGRSGYTYGSANQNALTVAPGNATWGGDQRDPVGALGGRPLTTVADNRIFFGGGGGAGDANGGASLRAGHGGGLIYIVSNNITGSGSFIADGETGPNTIGGHNDAPGGGGGGGTVIVKTATYAGPTISANGGNGGNQLITSNESEGPGGGGGGGYIAVSAATNGTPGVGATITKTANGGVSGITTSLAVTEFVQNGATNGATGQATEVISRYFPSYTTCLVFVPDFDGDGILDATDIDDDNDGITDIVENKGLAPAAEVDANGNNIPDRYDPLIPGYTDANFDGLNDAGGIWYDADEDGLPNHLDRDSDNNGITDLAETGGTDQDGNGVVDGAFADTDGDGHHNTYDTSTGGVAISVSDADADGVPDYRDSDNDNDGLQDISETTVDANNDGVIDAFTDADRDGLNDSFDPDDDGVAGIDAGEENDPLVLTSNDANADGIPESYTLDAGVNSDGDARWNISDRDSDNDGTPDIAEARGVDTNGDGAIDGAFADTDGDGLGNTYDPTNGGVYLTGNDTDADGIRNMADLDSDNDGVSDLIEQGGTDADNNGVVDAFADTDNDGFSNAVDGDANNDGTAENTAGALVLTGTDANADGRADSYAMADDADGDVRFNSVELDADNDGIADAAEAGATDADNNGLTDGTDTDGDGILSGADAGATFGGNFAVPANTDGSTGRDFLDIDADNDGIPDNTEAQATASYLAPAGADADSDGLDDAYDSNDAAWGGSSIIPVNNDGADSPDFQDTDADNEGEPDIVEGFDTDGNGVANTLPAGTDADADGLDDNFDVNDLVSDATNGGRSPSSYPRVENGSDRDWRSAPLFPNDNDRDGVLNAADLDDDNDGIPDLTESGGANAVGDADSDGTLNYADPNFCTLNGAGVCANLDFDGDGTINAFDLDSDNDGLTDLVEAFGVDTDGDGVIDGAFGDTDGDGLHNTYDASSGGVAITISDTDADGQANYLDLDSDNDGITDLVESGGADPAGDGRPDNLNDADGDGYTDIYDPNDDGAAGIDGGEAAQPLLLTGADTNADGRPNSYASANNDRDAVAAFMDLDSDGDGLTDIAEAGGTDADGDGKVDTYTDADTDGFSDGYDPDDDGTAGIDAGETTQPLIRTTADANSNGKVDGAETITLGDGTTRKDADRDGKADWLDLDSDNDGLTDLVEAGGSDTDGDGIGGITTDADLDGYSDAYDPDDDGVAGIDATPGEDQQPLIRTAADANANAKVDGAERLFEGNGTTPHDSDSDGFADFADLDSDNDGMTDITEAGGSDVNGDGIATTLTDTDADGLVDTYDPDANNDGTMEGTTRPLAITTADANTNGKRDGAETATETNGTNHDTDRDGLADFVDLDTDNDGIADIVEAGGSDINGDGRVDLTTDADADGYADVYDSDDDGVAGTDLAPEDTHPLIRTRPDADNNGKVNNAEYLTEGDGVTGRDNDLDRSNWLDLDSDNDGITDLTESGGTDLDGDGRVDVATDADQDGYADIYDSDDDGVPGVDAGEDTQPLFRSSADADNNGKVNNAERYNEGDGATSHNLDYDNLPDYLDADSDNDGITDLIEMGGSDADGDGWQALTITDADADGYTDTFDPDDDGVAGIDATPGEDRQPLVRASADADGNGKVNGTDYLAQGDGTTTTDSDRDGLSNAYDADSDNDGIPDLIEAGGTDANGDGNAINLTDADRDGLHDTYDPNDDFNNTLDGGAELTQPLVRTTPDSDADGKLSGAEYLARGDGFTRIDSDRDGVVDHLDLDSDNDGLTDLAEAGGSDLDGDGRVNIVVSPANIVFVDVNNNGVYDIAIDNIPADADRDGFFDRYDSDDEGAAGAEDATDPLVRINGDAGGNLKIDGADFYARGDGTTRHDMESDLRPNWLDRDADGDGITDLVEAGGTDSDGDGRNDYTSTDADRDGYADAYDSDDDGVAGVDAGEATQPLIRSSADANNNSKVDVLEAFTAGDGVSSLDIDRDNRPNFLDTDSDNDGITDLIEAGGADVNGDGFLPIVYAANIGYFDANDNGIREAGEVTLSDSDGDGYFDLLDPDDDGTTGIDAGEDQQPLIRTSGDSGSDGKVNGTDAYTKGNPAQSSDIDRDGLADFADLDSDGDGLTDIIEAGGADSDGDGKSPATRNTTTGALVIDDNENGSFDAAEVTAFDFDNDGYMDMYDPNDDNNATIDNPTQPLIRCTADANGSGKVDGTEIFTTSDGTTRYDIDRDGLGGYLDLDTDSDGIPDITEALGSDLDGDGKADLATDADRDGLADTYDPDDDGVAGIDAGESADALARSTVDSDKTGLIDGTEYMTNGAGTVRMNVDADTRPNFADLDSENDGITDLIEAGGSDTNGDGIVNVTTDADADGLADAYDPDDDGIAGIDAGEDDQPLTQSGADANNNGKIDNGEGLFNSTLTRALDADNDGLLDFADRDADNDGLPDYIEARGADANGDGVPASATDADRDGYVDVFDPDDDGTPGIDATAGEAAQPLAISSSDDDADGKVSGAETITWGDATTSLDFDRDRIPNWADVDTDNDGIGDLIESLGADVDGDGRMATALFTDNDADGFADIFDPINGATAGVVLVRAFADNGAGGGGLNNGKLAGAEYLVRGGTGVRFDNDGDARPDYADLDSDADGIPDLMEARGSCADGSGFVNATADADGDGYHDAFDPDDDFVPGIDAGEDQQPLMKTAADANSDGLISAGEAYLKGDGTPNDFDGDALPDGLDRDTDNDGLSDLTEAGGADIEGDGRQDYTDDNDADGYVDVYDPDDDNDGVIDVATDPLVRTTGDANANSKVDGSDRFVSGSLEPQDTDQDGLPGWADRDSDNDGITDLIEAGGIDTDGDGVADDVTDTEADGFVDIYDADDDNDLSAEGFTDPLLITTSDDDANGKVNNLEYFALADGSTTHDTDGDGIPDFRDMDSDNDGLTDAIEAGGIDHRGEGHYFIFSDADADGYNDRFDPDDDGTPGVDAGATQQPLVRTSADAGADWKTDGITDTYVRGDGVAKIDLDLDNVADFLDLDSDNDAIPDLVESGGADATGNGRADVATDIDFDGYSDAYDPDDNNDGTIDPGASLQPLVKTVEDANSDAKLSLADGARSIWYPAEADQSATDTDRDGLLNAHDRDSDGDGAPDALEANNGLTPPGAHNAQGVIASITDSGTPTAPADGWDNNFTNASALLPSNADANADGVANEGYASATDDVDNDRRATPYDIDADNDGILDADELQPSSSTRVAVNNDTDGDGIDNAFDPDCAPCVDAMGAIVTIPTNTDGADNPDYLDVDADNDNHRDWIEGFDEGDLDTDALTEYVAKMTAWIAANCPASPACAAYSLTDNDADGHPAWTDLDDATPVSDQGVNFLPPFLDPANATYYFDSDKDGLIDLYDTPGGVSEEPSFGIATASVSVPAGATMLTPDYRDPTTALITFPVEWLGFTAETQNNDAILWWATATEQNVSHFEIERSTDGVSFARIGAVNAAGTTEVAQEYGHTDPNVALTVGRSLYYRIRSVDLDGQETQTDIAHVQFNGGNSLVAWPNPASGTLHITAQAAEDGHLHLLNALGQEVLHQEVSAGKALHFAFDTESLAKGVYMLMLDTGDVTTSLRVVVE